MRWVGHVARLRETRNVYKILIGKPEGKRSLDRPRRRWLEIGWKGVDWMHLAEIRDQ
jgi:hypothetical protein